MHPNAELAQELVRCVKSGDEELAILGLRRGLIIKDNTCFVLTKKGLAFVEKWGNPHAHKQQASIVVEVTTPFTGNAQTHTRTDSSVHESRRLSQNNTSPYGRPSYNGQYSRHVGDQQQQRHRF